MRDLKRALGYCRVSTSRQFTEGNGLERYIAMLKNFGLTDEQIYYDIESGNSEKRAGYNKILAEVRKGNVDKVIVPCFDRFTRSPLGWEQATAEFLKYNVELLFLDGGNLDLTNPDGLFTGRILAAMSAQVRDKNRYNSVMGHRFFQQNHKAYKPCFGFEKEDDKLVPNNKLYKASGKTYAELAVEIIDFFLDCGGISKTIKHYCKLYGYDRIEKQHLDFPRNMSAFRRWLQNSFLCGDTQYYFADKNRTETISGTHQGIISQEKFKEVQRKLALVSRARDKNSTNPLVSICYCGTCGSKMKKKISTRTGKKGKVNFYEYYVCTGRYPMPKNPKICTNKNFFKYNEVLDAVIYLVKSRAKQIVGAVDAPREITSETPKEVVALRKEIAWLETMDSDYKEVLQKKRARLNELIYESSIELDSQDMRHELYIAVSQPYFWEEATRGELTAIFSELISKVVFIDDNGVQSFEVVFK